jgi:hypothetical protein
MSCDNLAHYVAEPFLKNRLDALLKPIVGKLLGRNALLIKSNDTPIPHTSPRLLAALFRQVPRSH